MKDSFGMPIQPWRDEVGAWEQYHAALRPGDVVLIPAPSADEVAASVTPEDVVLIYGVNAKTVRQWSKRPSTHPFEPKPSHPVECNMEDGAGHAVWPNAKRAVKVTLDPESVPDSEIFATRAEWREQPQ